jgi:uncharacterized protein YcbK (DUF882 family)
LKNPTVTSIGLRVWLALVIFIAAMAALPASTAVSREADRTLKLFFGHTGERGEFKFKRNGRYDRGEIARLNKFLRDWRRNEPAKMDPYLLDLVWAIYKESGSKDYIHVVSAYRSPATNGMLRTRSSGVAKNSQHMLGKAMDWYVTDVPLARLRAIAMKLQGGGVGYYPRSGSPFVHTDTGNVRAWPRMTRQQLIALFPKGNTLHLPADGKPLPGYDRALAERRGKPGTALAYLDSGDDDESGEGGWLTRVFKGKPDDKPNTPAAAPATASAPAPAAPTTPAPAVPAVAEPPVLLAAVEAGAADPRLPRARPASEAEAETVLAALPPPAETDASLSFAPLPRSRPEAAAAPGAPAAPAPAAATAEDAIAALSGAAEPASEPASSTVLALQSESDPESDRLAVERAMLDDLAALRGSVPAPAEEAVTALAAVEAQSAVEPAPVPRPRPLAVAFAGTGLPSEAPAETPTPAAAEMPAVEPAALVIAAAEPAAMPAYRVDEGELRHLIGDEVDAAYAFTGFAMPQPAGAPGLFSAPASADSVVTATGDELPTDRFQLAAAAPTSGEPSFFSSLLASLVN